MTSIKATAEEAVQKWLDTFVIELNLCPFAKPVLRSQALELVTINGDAEKCLTVLVHSCERLDANQSLETTLLILETGFSNFDNYLDLIALSEALLANLQYEGVYQLASFHPHYVFAGNSPSDLDNYTNRSPYPLIHLLRESSITSALTSNVDAADIPERNRQTMLNMNEQVLIQRFKHCFQAADD